MIKCKGVNFRSAHNETRVTRDTLLSFINGMLDDKRQEIFVPQWNMQIDKRTRDIYTQLSGKVCTNMNMTKRVILRGYSPRVYDTLPYGYTRAMLARLLADYERRYQRRVVYVGANHDDDE